MCFLVILMLLMALLVKIIILSILFPSKCKAKQTNKIHLSTWLNLIHWTTLKYQKIYKQILAHFLLQCALCKHDLNETRCQLEFVMTRSFHRKKWQDSFSFSLTSEMKMSRSMIFLVSCTIFKLINFPLHCQFCSVNFFRSFPRLHPMHWINQCQGRARLTKDRDVGYAYSQEKKGSLI